MNPENYWHKALVQHGVNPAITSIKQTSCSEQLVKGEQIYAKVY
ncbi:MAG: hypothetical protein RMY16_30905 [Nostoc sp. DedQUE12b]|nr:MULTISPECIES: hypothetical protein [unclassified Nostoc]MDZ7950298.1 hypothetical protein [Nostoc sp. DedQUE09]MDZ8089928.1 hypothetical protein [Nostoc sp. DedQUE12b]